jgi:2-polyprenyl-6-methoxyphenol hydroxylase-like FAD-dependent oxidoreductase
MTQRSALIVGAGVAGLAAAWWLAKIGWKAIVVERAPDLRANGYMLGLSGPGHEVVKRMGLLPQLEARGRHIAENVYRGRSGRELLRLRYRDFLGGLEWITLTRTDLVAVLYEAAREVADIRFGMTVADLRSDATGVDATLSDGTRFRADLLIGADGAHSAIRAATFGDETQFARPFGYRVAAFQAPDTLHLGADFLSYAEPGRLAEVYTLVEGRIATLYIWRTADRGFVAPASRADALRAAFAGTHPDALGWIDALGANDPIFFDDVELIDMPAWSKGRVLLLGDSAHCLTLISGQGAGMALTSACLLAEELAVGDIDVALHRHEQRLRPAIVRLQTRSRKMAEWFIPATPFAFHARNTVMRLMPRFLLGRYFLKAVRSEILAAASLATKPA